MGQDFPHILDELSDRTFVQSPSWGTCCDEPPDPPSGIGDYSPCCWQCCQRWPSAVSPQLKKNPHTCDQASFQKQSAFDN